jgi:hypothetical protein
MYVGGLDDAPNAVDAPIDAAERFCVNVDTLRGGARVRVSTRKE